MTRRVVLLPMLVVTIVVTTVLLSSSPALGHAYVEASVPTDGETLASTPPFVSVTFDDLVRAPIAAIKVYDDQSRRVDADDARIDPDDPRTVIGSIDGELPEGVYVVTWRAISTDDHTVIGSFTFRVGLAAIPTAGETAAPTDLPSAAAVPLGLRTAHLAQLGATVLLAGMGATALLLLRRRSAAWGPARASVLGAMRMAALVAALATIVVLVWTGLAQAGTDTRTALAGAAVERGLLSVTGVAAMVRLVLLVPTAAGADLRPAPAWLVAVLALVPLATLAVGGHPLAEAGALGVAVDVAHASAAAVWTGGLVALLLALQRRPATHHPASAASLVGDFSRLAGWMLLAVAVSGTALVVITHPGVRGLGDLPVLTASPHGRLLLAKLALVTVAGLLGLSNRRLLGRLTPVVAGGAVDAPAATITVAPDRSSRPSVAGEGGDGPRRVAPAWVRLRRVLVLELAVLLAVVAVTAALTDADADSRPARGAFTSTVALGADGLVGDVALVVRDDRGPTLSVTLRDDDGRLVDGADVLVRMDHAATSATTTRRLTTDGRGRYAASLGDVAVSGEWQLDLQVGTGLFDVREAEVSAWVP